MRKTIAGALVAALPTMALAQDGQSETIDIGITTFLTGPASVFGVPARDAAQMLIEQMNADGGIAGVPINASFIDEGAGGEALLAEYRRLAETDGVDVMMGSISSGNCGKIAPLAEDLRIVNIMWDCGTQRIFEENEYDFVFRTQANATPEMLASVLYLLKTRPDFETIAVVNQDYAWGRDSWDIFSTALAAMKPDVRVVGEFFPAFGAPDYSTEISRLQALRPDVILSTSWGGDLDTFVRQSAQRGLMNVSTFVLPLGESSLERLGDTLPEGVIIGARGDHYFMHPERRDDEDFQAFVGGFRDKTGAYPIYSVFHMAQALKALKAAYERAIEHNDGAWPDNAQLAAAFEGLSFQGFGRPVTIREDNQGIEAQLLGTTTASQDHAFAVLENIMIFDGGPLTAPVGETSLDWVGTLTPDFIDKAPVDMFDR